MYVAYGCVQKWMWCVLCVLDGSCGLVHAWSTCAVHACSKRCLVHYGCCVVFVVCCVVVGCMCSVWCVMCGVCGVMCDVCYV